jgi:hypothetical protein
MRAWASLVEKPLDDASRCMNTNICLAQNQFAKETEIEFAALGASLQNHQHKSRNWERAMGDWRLARGEHGLPQVLLWSAMPRLSIPCGRAFPETTLRPFQG